MQRDPPPHVSSQLKVMTSYTIIVIVIVVVVVSPSDVCRPTQHPSIFAHVTPLTTSKRSCNQKKHPIKLAAMKAFMTKT